MIELTIEELSQRWEWLFWELGIEKLHVTEQSLTNCNKSFIVHNLTMELENVCVVCSDTKDILIKNQSIMSIFLQKSLKSAYLLPIDTGTGFQERLEFEDGVILIEQYVD